MNGWAISWALICASGLGAIGWAAFRTWHTPLVGTQQIIGSLIDILAAKREVMKVSGRGDTIWVIAGEMNPRFYGSIEPDLREALSRGAHLEIIAGPRVLIEDKDYNPGDDYWGVHPIVRLAHDFPGKVKLYLRWHEENPRLNHAFGSTNRKAPCIMERDHQPGGFAPALVERGSEVGYSRLWARFRETITLDQVKLWSPDDPDKSASIQYVTRSQLQALAVRPDESEQATAAVPVAA